MLESLITEGRIPSPLILEGENLEPWIHRVVLLSLCESRSACKDCRGCKKAQKAFHPDWIQVDGSIEIEEVREHLSHLRQKPFEAPIRLLTMTNFQDANTFVQNALLKTLEEPLPHWIILLGVSSRFKLLDTIRSRCLIYKVPSDLKNPTPLSASETELFHFIEKARDLESFEILEPLFKDRNKSKDLFIRLLKVASDKSYPAFWAQLAPHLEQALPELTRNLHPRLVWDRAGLQVCMKLK